MVHWFIKGISVLLEKDRFSSKIKDVFKSLLEGDFGFSLISGETTSNSFKSFKSISLTGVFLFLSIRIHKHFDPGKLTDLLVVSLSSPEINYIIVSLEILMVGSISLIYGNLLSITYELNRTFNFK